MTTRLASKVVLITGAASGIGWATAQSCAREGASVVLADLGSAPLQERLQELRSLGGEHRAIALDVTSEQDWIAAMEEVEESFGRLDALVNNAGIGYFRPIVEMSLSEWRHIMAVNLDGVFLGTKYAMPLLARSGKGSIVNVSSIRGLIAGPNVGAYSASKAGVRLFTKATAVECGIAGNGVRANSVHPGVIETPLSARALDEATKKQRYENIPLHRFGKPEEIAAAIVFLASDESSYMTGSEVTIDGGYTAQ